MGIRVLPVDRDDDRALREWYDVYAPAIRVGRVDPVIPTHTEIRNVFLPDSTRHSEVFLAYDGDRPAGAGGMQFPLIDNTSSAWCVMAVLPELRRRGVGTALYEHAAERARADSRTSVIAQVEVPPGELESAPGVAFASTRGLTARNTEIRRQLRLPVPAAKLDALAAKAAERSGGYELLSWTGRCPDQFAEQYAQLQGLLATEAPHGDLEMEAERWDVGRLRENEALAETRGDTTYATVAVAPGGELAGHTQLLVGAEHRGRAHQLATLVLDVHRGHRLGLAAKVANLRAFQAAHPDVGRIGTTNAEQNAPMVKVNVELGFEIVEPCQVWQGDI